MNTTHGLHFADGDHVVVADDAELVIAAATAGV